MRFSAATLTTIDRSVGSDHLLRIIIRSAAGTSERDGGMSKPSGRTVCCAGSAPRWMTWSRAMGVSSWTWSRCSNPPSAKPPLQSSRRNRCEKIVRKPARARAVSHSLRYTRSGRLRIRSGCRLRPKASASNLNGLNPIFLPRASTAAWSRRSAGIDRSFGPEAPLPLTSSIFTPDSARSCSKHSRAKDS